MRRSFITAALAAASAAGLAQGQNLLTNPSFEDLDADTNFGDGWGSFGNAGFFDFFASDGVAHAFFFGDTVGNSGGVFQTAIPATPGLEYHFSIDVSWESDWDASTRIGLEFYAADDATKLGETVTDVTETDLGNGYVRIAVAADAPSGAVFVRPIVLFDTVNTSGSNRGAAFDNASLVEKLPGDNLTRNPGFLDLNADEAFGDEWLTYGNAGYNNFFGSGNPGHGTLFGDSVFNLGGAFQLDVPAIPGETYTMGIDIQFEENWDAYSFVALEFYASDDATKLGEVMLELTDGPPPVLGYQRYTLDAEAPAGAAYVRPVVAFDFVNSDGTSRAATFDNLTITRAAGELLANPSLEDIVGDGNYGDLWGTFGNHAFLDFFPSDRTAHSTFFADTIGNFGGIFQVDIPATEGETYEFAVDLSIEADFDASLRFGLEFYEADDGTKISEVIEEATTQLTPGGGYARLSVLATAPAGAAYVRPIVLFDSVNSEGGQRAATADNLSLRVAAEETCPADQNNDGFFNNTDVNLFVNNFLAQNPAADINADGFYNNTDINLFVNLFLTQCN